MTVANTSNTPLVRPWIRFWARSIDTILWIPFLIITPSIEGLLDSIMVIGLFGLIGCFVEAKLLSSVGTTPGKWLLGVKVRNKDKKISFSDALDRSIYVLAEGLAMGIPIASLFAQFSAYRHLKKEGKTAWDESGYFTVIHEKIKIARIGLAIFIIFLVFMLLIFLNVFLYY